MKHLIRCRSTLLPISGLLTGSYDQQRLLFLTLERCPSFGHVGRVLQASPLIFLNSMQHANSQFHLYRSARIDCLCCFHRHITILHGQTAFERDSYFREFRFIRAE